MSRPVTSPMWGTTSSAVSAFGAAPRSDWYRWEEGGRAPRSGEGNGMATDFAEDFALLAGLGLTTHQLTLDWARLEPEAGRWDDDAIERQTEVLRSARSQGIDVWACLLDHALPGWFSEDEGGLLDDRARGYFWARFVDRCGELFGDAVTGWVPVRSPLSFAHEGYLTGSFPPGERSAQRFTLALRGAHRAGFDAWRLLSSGDRPVMCSMDLAVVEPRTTGREPREQVAAERNHRRIEGAMWTSWIRAIEDGVLMIPGRADEAVPEALGAYDLIGFSYQGGLGARAEDTTPYPAGAPVDATGRSVWSEGLGLVLRRLAESLPRRSLVITGCEVATRPGTDEDDLRAQHLAGCLDEVERALGDGIPIAGFLAGTAVDGYEWGAGFGIETGVIDRSRNPKASGRALADRRPVTFRVDRATE